MPIPTAALPHRIAVEPYLGQTGTGALAYGAPQSRRARVIGKRRAVRTSEGVDVIADATATIRPTTHWPKRSRVTWQGRTYDLLGVSEQMELRRPLLHELILKGPRP